jgi:AcrR family transcriptional regulator
MEDVTGTTRRHGTLLEEAILQAVRAEVAEHGYAATTYEAVATRARTSKPVLYRRWATKARMVLAAMTAVQASDYTTPDTGSLRGDLAALLQSMRTGFEQNGRSTLLSLIADLRQQDAAALRTLMFARGVEMVRPALIRAQERDELGPGRLPERVLLLPFDLARHELLIAGSLPDDALLAILDDVVLPLFVVRSREVTLPAEGSR